MEKSEIKAEIKKVLVKILKHEDYDMSDDMTASNVNGWDSLTHMLIISDIETCFNIKFRLRELNKLTNMGALVQLITQKI